MKGLMTVAEMLSHFSQYPADHLVIRSPRVLSEREVRAAESMDMTPNEYFEYKQECLHEGLVPTNDVAYIPVVLDKNPKKPQSPKKPKRQQYGDGRPLEDSDP